MRGWTMPARNRRISQYDAYAHAYAACVRQREQGDAGDDLGILPHLLALLGDVRGRRVLDAGCGEGYLARILAARGARVTGIDLSPRLIALARAKDTAGAIEYRVADLSAPLPADAGRFDAIASYLVLNDMEDYRGFATTVGQLLTPGGRARCLLSPHPGGVPRRLSERRLAPAEVGGCGSSEGNCRQGRRAAPAGRRGTPPLHGSRVCQALAPPRAGYPLGQRGRFIMGTFPTPSSFVALL